MVHCCSAIYIAGAETIAGNTLGWLDAFAVTAQAPVRSLLMYISHLNPHLRNNSIPRMVDKSRKIHSGTCWVLCPIVFVPV
jgi:hypothetical protein